MQAMISWRDSMDEKVKAAMAAVALPMLVERHGGKVTFSRDEYEAMGARYGGFSRLGVQVEYDGETLTLTLVAKHPATPLS
jgi:hypothetical protein